MHIIKNYDSLASSPLREKALQLVEVGLLSIQPDHVLNTKVKNENNRLQIADKEFDISQFERIFLVGFGKGSSGVAKYLEGLLGEKLTEGWDIDVVDESFAKIHYTKGTHPLPSQVNIDYTQHVLESLTNLSEKDLVLVVICGGGSALFESSTVTLDAITHVNDVLLKSGANISEMNVIRKHLSKVKGGKFAKHLYPATVVGLLFSDVPGNDLSVIASGPTVADKTTDEDVKAILRKYNIESEVGVGSTDFLATVSEEKYFEKVHNILVVSNQTALSAMAEKAKELGLLPQQYTDKLQGDAKELGKKLLDETKSREVLLAGGESTVHVTGTGKGGRNQALVLASLPYISEKTVIVSFGSDGWDFFGYAGAIGDEETSKKAKELGLDPKAYSDNDDSHTFFEKEGDGIDTGKLESNVSDLFIVIKE